MIILLGNKKQVIWQSSPFSLNKNQRGKMTEVCSTKYLSDTWKFETILEISFM